MGPLPGLSRRHRADRMLGRAERPLVYRATSGLCNRIKGVVALQRQARHQGREPFLVWQADADVGARYTDLFEQVVPLLPGRPTIDTAWLGPVWRLWVDEEELPVETGNATPYADPTRPTIDFLYGETPGALIDAYVPYFRALQPIASIRRRIERVRRALDRPYLGVHMRRTDFVGHPVCAPADVRTFAEAVERLRSPGQPVFVATDDPAAVEALEATLGHGVVAYSTRARGRQDRRAIQDAVVDLFVLSAAERLIGTYASTFSETAWWLSGGAMPVEILGGSIGST